MLNLVCNIEIEQQPTKDYPNRGKKFTFDFVTEVEINSTWANLSDTGKIVVPQKLYFKDANGDLYSWDGKNIGGGYNTDPIILRGDKVLIDLGYFYYDVEVNSYVTKTNRVFQGYVSAVISNRPMEIHVMDNMWKLQQTSAPNKQWTNYSLESMVKELLKGTGYDYNTNGSTSIITPPIITQNQTVAEVLEMLRKYYRVESWFRNNTLHSAFVTYFPNEANKHNFKFQHNIVNNDLTYQRKDDVVIGVNVYSVEKFSSGTTKRGTPKKSSQRLSQFALWERGLLKFYNEKPLGFEGEIRTLNLYGTDKKELQTLCENNMYRIVYDGFKGTFTTFGLPYVKHGDSVKLQDAIMPDRNGTYKVKGVRYLFGQGGFRQVITVDLRLDDIPIEKQNKGL